MSSFTEPHDAVLEKLVDPTDTASHQNLSDAEAWQSSELMSNAFSAHEQLTAYESLQADEAQAYGHDMPWTPTTNSDDDTASAGRAFDTDIAAPCNASKEEHQFEFSEFLRTFTPYAYQPAYSVPNHLLTATDRQTGILGHAYAPIDPIQVASKPFGSVDAIPKLTQKTPYSSAASLLIDKGNATMFPTPTSFVTSTFDSLDSSAPPVPDFAQAFLSSCTPTSCKPKCRSTSTGLATPRCADLRLIGNVNITCEELLCFLPNHLTYEAILRRLRGNGWRYRDIVAAVNYFRDWTKKGEALNPSLMYSRFSTLEYRHNKGNLFAEAARNAFYKPIRDFTAQTWSNRWPGCGQNDCLLVDLAQGVVQSRRPEGEAAGQLSKCIEYAEQHPNLGLRLSQVQQIILEQGLQSTITTNGNIDREALVRMSHIVSVRKYRYPDHKSSMA